MIFEGPFWPDYYKHFIYLFLIVAHPKYHGGFIYLLYILFIASVLFIITQKEMQDSAHLTYLFNDAWNTL